MPANTNAQTIDHDHTVYITRTFNAPRALVWKAWTDPVHMMQWFCPTEFNTVSVDVDLRIGGKYRFAMRSPKSGKTHIAGGIYKDIKEPERLVYTHIWEQTCADECEEKESEMHGVETLVTVDFIEQDGKTIINFMHEGLLDADTTKSHTGGWSSFLDHLDQYLKTL